MKRKGFTLLELLVVVAILAALVALALPYYQDYVSQTKLTAAKADLATFNKALTNWDQLESGHAPLVDNEMTPLIGKYLQDFRSTANQKMPIDPWGSPYELKVADGYIRTYGPDRTPGVVTKRVVTGDDLLVTWKPPYYISLKYVTPDSVDVIFTRKVANTPAFGVLTLDHGATTASVVKISDTQFRFTLAAPLTGATHYTGVVAAVPSLDGATGAPYDDIPNSPGTEGNTDTFDTP
ncbi:MAG: prepilin-type N-terminal cleavage/methylation domain-containing protein [Candidatus Riflebacteria bacterium]|nr:prepilin-type N-terminal cleavage/methylation domain-containing protein [Candidatus Riflebacteria bacterium]